MSKTAIVVEEGVIQCEHGGKVVLTSSESVHVIGGKKPMHDIDLVGAPIQGCPHRVSVGGNCTSVASISSAVTEDNVAASGVKYLLRVDGCKTDKGAALVLVDPGQTNTVVPVKSSGGGEPPAITALEGTELDTKENIKKEHYRIYPLRRSSKQVRALRAARDFDLSKETYDVHTGSYTADKVVTKTEAYLYVSFEDVTREFKVINRGDIFNPAILDVQFIETKTKVLRRHIPFYKESGTAEFVYSNVRLKKDDLANFTPVLLTFGDAKATCVNHHKEISKSIKHEEKTFSKKTTRLDDLKRSNVKYRNVLLLIDDPIGEVEDLYNEYEFSYHRHYGMNKNITDDLRVKNQYPYAVADLLNYFYVDRQEKKEHQAQTKLLKEQYTILADGLRKELGHLVIDKKIGNNIAPLIDYQRAKDFLHKLQHFDKNFLDDINGFDVYKENHRYHYSKFSVLKLSASIAPAAQYEKRKQNDTFKTPTDKELYGSVNKTKPIGYLMPQEVPEVQTDALAENQKIVEGLNFINRKDNIAQHLILSTSYEDYKGFSKSPADVLALLVFNIFYSENEEFEQEVKKHASLADAREKFYYLLKTATIQPQANQKALDDIYLELQYQSELTNVFAKKPPLLEEFENLDNYLKKTAFDSKTASSKKAKNNYGFKALKSGTEAKEIEYDKSLRTAKVIAEDLKTALSSKELERELIQYMSIQDFEDDEQKHNYYHYLYNLSYMLIAPRATLDEESNYLSMFNKKFDAIRNLVTYLTIEVNGLDEEKAFRLHEEKVKTHYLTALYALITHAKVPMLKKERAKGSNDREKNVAAFLSQFEKSPSKQFAEFHKPMDIDYDKDQKVKTEVEKTFETLNTLNSITQYVEKVDDAAEKSGSRRGESDDLTKDARPIALLRKSPMYKALLNSTKSLSFIITLRSVYEFSHGMKKVNLENLIGFADDVSTLTKSLTALVPSAQKAAQESATKALVNINNISEVSTEVSKIGKGLSFASLKALVSLGVAGVIVHSVNEINKLEGTNNKDMIIAVKTKTAIYLALLFTPAWIAVGTTILTELVWAFIKDAIYNSKIEQYLYQSLLFNTTEHNKHRLFNAQEGTGYKASIMLETFKGEGIDLGIGNFKTLDALRKFIANNYTQHHDTFDRAMKNELTQLNAIVYDLNLSVSKYKTNIEDESEHHVVSHVYTHVKLPRSAHKSFKALVHLHNGKPIKNQRKLEMHDDSNIYYNTLEKATVSSLHDLQNEHNEELIIATDDMALKYKVIYEANSSPMGNELSAFKVQLENLKITRLDLAPLSEQDYKFIEEAQQ